MKRKLWKKGDRVVRLYGSNSWGRDGSMKQGDVATVLENQEYPGVVELKEFPDGMGHDPMRLRRLKDYPNLTPKEIVSVYQMVNDQDFESILKLLSKSR